MVRDIRQLELVILYRKTEELAQTFLTTFLDASFNISSQKSYGQTGVISVICVMMKEEKEHFSIIDWVSTKQKKYRSLELWSRDICMGRSR